MKVKFSRLHAPVCQYVDCGRRAFCVLSVNCEYVTFTIANTIFRTNTDLLFKAVGLCTEWVVFLEFIAIFAAILRPRCLIETKMYSALTSYTVCELKCRVNQIFLSEYLASGRHIYSLPAASNESESNNISLWFLHFLTRFCTDGGRVWSSMEM